MTVVRSAPEQLPCIWAEAGVLSYRLCDRHYECEGCSLFQALSGRPGMGAAADQAEPPPAVRPDGGAAAPETACLARLLAGCTLRLDRAYSAGHWWLDAARPPVLTLGLEAAAIRVLAPVEDIVLPRPGTRVRRSAACAWMVRGRTAVPLTPPVGGTVEETNRDYADTMRVWGRYPGEDDWLLRLVPDDDPETVPGLYRGEAALTWHLQNLQLLRQVLREAVEARGTLDLGATMNDGGEPTLDLESVLGRARFESLVARMFPTPAS